MAGPMQMSPQQFNAIARDAIITRALEMEQTIYNQTIPTPNIGQVVNIPIRPVGLVKRLIVEINGTVAPGAAETQNLTKIGLANLLSQVVFTDLNNQQRIITTGWHLHFLACVRHQRAYGAAVFNDSPINIGANLAVIAAPAAIQSATQVGQKFRMFYEIPLAYSDRDYRGAVYAGTVNAVMNLQLTVNPNFFLASGTDQTLGVYQSSSAQLGALTGVTIAVNQVYMDQLPMTKNGPVLPAQDLSTVYALNNTSLTGMTVGQDFPVNYANQRNFMSTFAIYDNVGLNPGSDVTSWALQAANFTNIFKVDPFRVALKTREIIRDDFPPGVYYFDHRKKALNTIQYGNLQLVLNPSSVTSAASQLLMGFEAFAQVAVLTQASSLPAG